MPSELKDAIVMTVNITTTQVVVLVPAIVNGQQSLEYKIDGDAQLAVHSTRVGKDITKLNDIEWHDLTQQTVVLILERVAEGLRTKGHVPIEDLTSVAVTATGSGKAN